MTAIDPRKLILHAARDFRLASQMLQAHFGESRFPLRSTVVTTAFSVELYLKYLAATQGADPPRGHDILKIFAALSPELQALVRQHFTDPKPLDQVLKDNKAVFIDWRYIYENQEGASLDFSSLSRLASACDAAAQKATLSPLSGGG